MKRLAYALIFSAVACFPVVVAALPPDRVVHYAIREDPADPDSRIQYVLSLSLSAQEQNVDYIGWSVDNYMITETAVIGVDSVWDVDAPNVLTTDGLWWVKHADPDNPVRSDFVEPAQIADTASAHDPSDPDLHFDVAGVPYSEPPEGPPYAVTAALDFTFIKDGSSEPDDSGSHEPADVPDWSGAPGSGAQ